MIFGAQTLICVLFFVRLEARCWCMFVRSFLSVLPNLQHLSLSFDLPALLSPFPYLSLSLFLHPFEHVDESHGQGTNEGQAVNMYCKCQQGLKTYVCDANVSCVLRARRTKRGEKKGRNSSVHDFDPPARPSPWPGQDLSKDLTFTQTRHSKL
ncbi:hypothetical protein BKA57DRAFT_467766 [Linnemannia elongata]|nr:hypothetical protein BKA57DRAFT_467766 [Linnemannia elongata]